MAQTEDYGHTRINPQNLGVVHLSRKGFANDWETKKNEQLVDRIKFKLNAFDAYHLKTLMRHVKTKLRKIADGGVFNFSKDLLLF